MATSTVGFFSPFWGLPMQPLVAEVGDVSTDSRFTRTPIRQDVAKASGVNPREAVRCQTGRSIDDLCLAEQAGRSHPESLLSWRNVRLIAPRLLGRSPDSPPSGAADAANVTSPKAAIAPPPAAAPKVVVRPAAAPAVGAQQVFKQCLDIAQATPQASASVKRGSTQQPPNPPAPARPDAAKLYQVWVKGKVVMELASGSEAAQIAQRLTAALGKPEFSVDQLRLVLVDGKPSVVLGNVSAKTDGGDRLLFTVDRSLANRLGRTADLVAIDWFNNLRVALGEAPLSLMAAQADLYSLTQTDRSLGGITSWYGPGFHNRLTANGERFNQYALTAAHPKLPFNTYLRVTSVRSGASVIVRINDRGPYIGKRSLDLSRQAARCIGSEKPGVVRYEAVILEPQTTVQ